MARRVPENKFSWKRVAKGVVAGLLLISLIAGGNYWYTGHPRWPVDTCLSGEGLYVKILEIKDGKYIVLFQFQSLPIAGKAEGSIREFNAGDWYEIDCETGESK
jgi:hypothetical protein